MGAGGKVQFWSILGAFVPEQECGWGSNSKEVMMTGISVQHKPISVLALHSWQKDMQIIPNL